MSVLVSEALRTATYQFGGAPGTFDLEVSGTLDEQGGQRLELRVYKRGLNPVALLGLVLLVLAAPIVLIVLSLGNASVAIGVGAGMLVTGGLIRRSYPYVRRELGPSRTLYERDFSALL